MNGGSCNDYDYACGDPVNGLDLTGTVVTGKALTNTMIVYWVLRRSLSRTAAAALVGNFIYESFYTMSPTRQEDGGHAIGIAQWDDRIPLLQNTMGSYWDTLTGQMLFVLYELHTTEDGALDAINECGGDLMCATVAARKFYERPDPPTANDPARIDAATWVSEQWWAF